MKSRDSHSKHAAAAAALALVLAVPAWAQSGTGRQDRPGYDPATETTIAGTVTAVEQVASQPGAVGRHSMGGTHLQVKTTGGDTVAVHLGPTAYLDEHKVSLAKGDAVEVVGSRVTVDDEAVVIARSVKKGDTVWTLRDADGRPLWRGGRR